MKFSADNNQQVIHHSQHVDLLGCEPLRFERSDMSRAAFNTTAVPLELIPSGVFVLTAASEGRRGAVLLKWVQRCSENPPMVMVAVPKGLPTELLIQGTQSFALFQIDPSDRYLTQKFNGNHVDHEELVCLSTQITPLGLPVIDRALTAMDCTIARHIEFDSDYRVYVGQVQTSAVLNAPRENGTKHNGHAGK